VIWILDNIRPSTSAIVGLRLVLKFGLDWIYSFGDIVIFIFCRFGLKLPIHAHFLKTLGAYFPQMTSPTVLIPKGTSLRGNTSLELLSVKIGSAVRPGRIPDRKAQDRERESKKPLGWVL